MPFIPNSQFPIFDFLDLFISISTQNSTEVANMTFSKKNTVKFFLIVFKHLNTILGPSYFNQIVPGLQCVGILYNLP